MDGWMRKAAAAIALALLLPMTGCGWLNLKVKILDFDARRVRGVWVWKETSKAGVYARVARMDLGKPRIEGSTEVLDYTSTNVGATDGLTSTATVIRDATDRGRVTLTLLYTRTETSGKYRVSSFNDAGESDLSATARVL